MTQHDNPDLRLDGQRAIVTGASRGIGLAIAERLGRNGARVALVSRKQVALDEAAASLARHGIETMTIAANMSDPNEVAGITPRVVAEWGGVDVLVNNAASNPVFGPITELAEQGWDKILTTNVKGPFLLSQSAAKDMLERGRGAIVNIASTGGFEPSPMIGAYCVSKAAIIMLTKVMAAELGPRGIRVNCIAPGLVETKFAEVLVNTPQIHDAYVSRAALRRHGQPAEIAGAAHFLASEAASYMTGQVMVIDGGTRY
jgi:NAD(P)-dependent dehydrogenase (short-subunit alcohol dehydrogenase family)